MFLGPPGVGKTHLAISLAIRAAERGRRVYYGSRGAGRVPPGGGDEGAVRRLRVLTHPALLVVDEIGYLPVTANGATCSSSSSTGATSGRRGLTSNKGCV